MTRAAPGPSRYRSLLASRRALARAAPLVRFGVFAAGVALFLDQVRPLVSDAQFTWGERRVAGLVALVTLGSFAVAGWVAGRLIRAAAELIEVFVEGAEAAVETSYLIETQLVPALVRASAALERLAEAGGAADGAGRSAAAVRRAIAEGRWARAEQLVRDLLRDDPGAPEAAALAGELDRARRAEADDLLGRLDAAFAAEDPDRVLACRDALTRHLRGDALHDLDRRAARWLARYVQDRARAGAVDAGLAALAARVAETFDTPEGALVHDALPSLRRRAGLCPGCGGPFRGGAKVCPDCRAAAPSSPMPPPTPRPAPGGPIPGRTP